MADPSIMFSAPNAGAAFAQAFQAGQQQRQEQQQRNALAALAMNPSDPQAQAAAAQFAPQAVMQARQGQAELAADQHQEWAKIVGEAAKQAHDPQTWDQIVDYFVANGHPEAAKLKGQFSPALRAAFMAQGGVSDDKAAQDPGIIREFEIATQRGLIPPGTPYESYLRMRNPGLSSPVTIPYGATVAGGGGESMPTVSSPGEAMNLPPGSQFRLPDGRIGTVPGGAGGNASGGF